MECLGEDTIIEFLQGGRLSEEETDAVEKHIDVCEDCRLLVAELARTSISEDPTPSPPTKHNRASKPVLYAAADGYVIDPNAFGDDDLTDPRMDDRPTFRLRKGDSGVTLADELDTDPGFHSTLPPVPLDTGLGESSQLQPGAMISERYRIIQFLGAGGMGTVYEAHDEQLAERIALKVLRPELKNIPQLLERLHHEVVLGRRITHPNICRLHDIGTYGDIHFITMELVRGESLDEHLKRGRPAGRLATSLLLQVCNALEAAHQKGVVHRDLKPGNIMIDWTAEPISVAPGLRSQQQLLQEIGGKVTVMDFGLARDLHGEHSQSGMLIGSPAYWSPEQSRGERATEQSDIYAVGVMACELFGSPRPTLGKVGSLSDLPAPYRPVIRRCLQDKPEDRYECAGSLRDALVAASRVAPKRRRFTLAAVSAVVVIIAALASYSLLAVFEPPAERKKGNPAPQAAAVAAVAPVIEVVSPKPSQPQNTVAAKQTQQAEKKPPQPVIEAASVEPTASSAAAKRTRRRLNRRRSSKRARVRTPAPAPPPAAAAAPAPAPAAEPDASTNKAAAEAVAAAARAEAAARKMMLTTIRQRAAAVERHRKAKGFLADDLPEYARQRRKLAAAIKAQDPESAGKAIEQLTLTLGRARIDSPFVSRKLKRINKQMTSRKLPPELAKRVKAIFSKVHARYFAGGYEDANTHLNHIWRLLKDKQ